MGNKTKYINYLEKASLLTEFLVVPCSSFKVWYAALNDTNHISSVLFSDVGLMNTCVSSHSSKQWAYIKWTLGFC